MISEKDLQEAIAECEGERNPNANTCLKLAAFYTIQNQLFGKTEKNPESLITLDDALKLFDIRSGTSKDSGIFQNNRESFLDRNSLINYRSNTEFSEAIKDKDINAVFSVMDELLDSVRVVLPRLYDSTLRKLYGL